MGIKDGELFEDNVIRISQMGQTKSAIIQNEKFSDYYIEETKHPIFDVVYDSNLNALAYETGIPLSRLTYDYVSLYELNPIYLEKLTVIEETIAPAMQFLIDHDVISSTKSYHEKIQSVTLTADEKIREFLNNAIN